MEAFCDQSRNYTNCSGSNTKGEWDTLVSERLVFCYYLWVLGLQNRKTVLSQLEQGVKASWLELTAISHCLRCWMWSGFHSTPVVRLPAYLSRARLWIEHVVLVSVNWFSGLHFLELHAMKACLNSITPLQHSTMPILFPYGKQF